MKYQKEKNAKLIWASNNNGKNNLVSTGSKDRKEEEETETEQIEKKGKEK